jgi:hypothetical protein
MRGWGSEVEIRIGIGIGIGAILIVGEIAGRNIPASRTGPGVTLLLGLRPKGLVEFSKLIGLNILTPLSTSLRFCLYN